MSFTPMRIIIFFAEEWLFMIFGIFAVTSETILQEKRVLPVLWGNSEVRGSNLLLSLITWEGGDREMDLLYLWGLPLALLLVGSMFREVAPHHGTVKSSYAVAVVAAGPMDMRVSMSCSASWI